MTATTLTLAGCAGMSKKYENVTKESLYQQLDQVKGKDPKQVATQLGEPISVGWENPSTFGQTRYFLAYIVGNGQSTMTDLMLGGENKTCRIFRFEEENGYKHTGSNSDGMDYNCSVLKANKFDDSKIK